MQENLKALRNNAYSGRGLILGVDESGRYLIQIYWITGRSENSRNRIFEKEGGRLFTVAADPTKLKDPSLIIYNAMDQTDGHFVVSNGHQTDEIIGAYKQGRSFQSAMDEQEYEPDAPNFTPRIAGTWNTQGELEAIVGIIKKDPTSKECVRNTTHFYGIKPGTGFCVTTYAGDGDPLPSFMGAPYPLPLKGLLSTITNTYWKVLNSPNRQPSGEGNQHRIRAVRNPYRKPVQKGESVPFESRKALARGQAPKNPQKVQETFTLNAAGLTMLKFFSKIIAVK
jgi:IMP cyclohydrolase